MFKGRRTKKRSAARGRSSEDSGHELDEKTSDGEGQVSTMTGGVEQDSAVAAPLERYTPPPRPRLYAAAAPRPLSNREHHLQLAGRLYEIEMERILNGRQEKFSAISEQYYRHLLESASPVSVASPNTSSVDDTAGLEASSPSSHNSTVPRTTHHPAAVQENSSVVQLSSDSVCQTAHGTNRTEPSASQSPVSHLPSPNGDSQSTFVTSPLLENRNGPTSEVPFVASPSYRSHLHHTAAYPHQIYAGAPVLLVPPIRTSSKFWTTIA
ncbi:unnamed protein product [Ascophyllum nodosum]